MHCSIQKQLVDVLTKVINTDQFLHLKDGIGVVTFLLTKYELRDGVRNSSYSIVEVVLAFVKLNLASVG